MAQVNQQRFDKRFAGRKVLLVSENVQELRYCAKLCEAEHFETVLCNSSEAAVNLVEQEAFDLVVVHQGFPAPKDRNNVLQYLSRCSPSTPLLSLTNPDNLARCLRAFAMAWRFAEEREKPPQPTGWRSSVSFRDETSATNFERRVPLP